MASMADKEPNAADGESVELDDHPPVSTSAVPTATSIQVHPEGLAPSKGWQDNGSPKQNGADPENNVESQPRLQFKPDDVKDSKVIAYVLAVFTCLVALLLIIVGATFLNDCYAENMIPMYILILGICLMLASAFVLVIKLRPVPQIIINGFIISFSLFMTCWLICGCVWIYGVVYYESSKVSHIYCHHFIYKFSFSIVTIYLVAEILMIAFACFICSKGKRFSA